MLSFGSGTKIYLCTGHTDMRKGIHGLSTLASGILQEEFADGGVFVFRGKRADKLKILWYDGQGFCLFYKCLDLGKFVWPTGNEGDNVGITRGQLSMLIESIDWRNPRWSNPPKYGG